MRAVRLVAVVVLAGCIDFMEPDLPQAGAPAVIEATVAVIDNGGVEVSARLAPGLDASGFRRRVRHDALRVLGQIVGPDSVRRNGTRLYDAMWEAGPGAVTGAVDIETPVVDGTTAPPPAVHWFGVRRVGPDMIRLEPGAPLLLAVDARLGEPRPVPAIRQWILTVAGEVEGNRFFLGAGGLPPDTIVVPRPWIPAGDSLDVRLTFAQSAEVRLPPGDYIGHITLNARVSWTVRVIRASGAAGAPQ